MQTAIERRRTRFLKALAATKQSQAAWARANEISKAHLSYVLNGQRASDKLTAKIDGFTREQLSKAS